MLQIGPINLTFQKEFRKSSMWVIPALSNVRFSLLSFRIKQGYFIHGIQSMQRPTFQCCIFMKSRLISFSTMALASPRVCVIWNYEIPHTVLFGWFLKCQCHYLFSMRVWLVTNGLIFIASYESRTWMVIAYTNYTDLQIRFDIYGRG